MKYYTPLRQQKRRSQIGTAFRSRQSQYKRRAQEMLASFTETDTRHRLVGMKIFSVIVIVIFVLRLFSLQVLHGSEYLALAQEQQYGKIIIPAKRGEILSQNSKTGELNTLATNTTLDLIYVDPQEIPDKKKVAKDLAPLLFDELSFSECKENSRLCPSGGVQFQDTQVLLNDIEDDEEQVLLKDTRTRAQLVAAYEQDLYKKISKEEVDYAPLMYGASDEDMDAIEKLAIDGITIIRNKNLVYVDPTMIDQSKISAYAKMLSDIVDKSTNSIKGLLSKRSVRYVPLKRRISPEVSEKIWALKKGYYTEHKSDVKNIPHYFKGVVLIPEHWRYYPENEIASTIIGYVDHEGYGRYGIEEKFQDLLKGRNGELLSQNDVNGSQLVFDVNQMKEAVDGDSIVLTIDRTIQSKVQELLASAVESYNADSGSIIVMNPFNGEVLAMGNYPNFDPNFFGQVYEIEKTQKEDWEWYLDKERLNSIYSTQPIFIKDEKGDYKDISYGSIKKEKELFDQMKKEHLDKIEGEKDIEDLPQVLDKYVYKNRFGLRSYVNTSVMSLYEPGSVFKPIVMAIALDANEVNPYDTYDEFGPIEIDTGTSQKQYIRTALGVYRGVQTMTNAIEQSSNIGMAFVARKLGRELFYKYILDFGFGDYTNIDLVGEQKGMLTFWKKWPEAQLLTTSFGQGISATPIQVVSAWSALANGGVMLQPKIVKTYQKENNENIDVDTQIVKRVISQKTSEKITAMLVSSVENGVASPAKVDGYLIAGKTGTSQISCADSTRCRAGRYEKGSGTTITSFAGYAPISKPKFVILVKFERPRIGNNTWGSTTAAPVFKELSEFLLRYYNIPPDDYSSLK